MPFPRGKPALSEILLSCWCDLVLLMVASLPIARYDVTLKFKILFTEELRIAHSKLVSYLIIQFSKCLSEEH
jgi:hypothetical protein